MSIIYKIDISLKKEKQLLGWFRNQNESLKTAVFREKRNQFFKLNSLENEPVEVIEYLSFISSINLIYEKLQTSNKKNKNMQLHNMKEISNLELLIYKKIKQPSKYDFIVDRIAVIRQLRKQSFSWRDISSFFFTRFRKEISHQYLKKVFNDLSSKGGK